jgi:hypothetical protein
MTLKTQRFETTNFLKLTPASIGKCACISANVGDCLLSVLLRMLNQTISRTAHGREWRFEMLTQSSQ